MTAVPIKILRELKKSWLHYRFYIYSPKYDVNADLTKQLCLPQNCQNRNIKFRNL